MAPQVKMFAIQAWPLSLIPRIPIKVERTDFTKELSFDFYMQVSVLGHMYTYTKYFLF